MTLTKEIAEQIQVKLDAAIKAVQRDVDVPFHYAVVLAIPRNCQSFDGPCAVAVCSSLEDDASVGQLIGQAAVNILDGKSRLNF